MDDGCRAVEEPFPQGGRGALLAATAQLLWGTGAVGHVGSRLAGGEGRASTLPGAADRRCDRGLLNKQIAAELGTSEVTVKLQRGHVMQKMRAASVAELVRMAENSPCRAQKAWLSREFRNTNSIADAIPKT
jgi:hypothetical protein